MAYKGVCRPTYRPMSICRSARVVYYVKFNPCTWRLLACHFLVCYFQLLSADLHLASTMLVFSNFPALMANLVKLNLRWKVNAITASAKPCRVGSNFLLCCVIKSATSLCGMCVMLAVRQYTG